MIPRLPGCQAAHPTAEPMQMYRNHRTFNEAGAASAPPTHCHKMKVYGNPYIFNDSRAARPPTPLPKRCKCIQILEISNKLGAARARRGPEQTRSSRESPGSQKFQKTHGSPKGGCAGRLCGGCAEVVRVFLGHGPISALFGHLKINPEFDTT